MFYVVGGLCFVVDDDVVERAVGDQLDADLVDDIYVNGGVLGLRFYYLLKLPYWMV